MIMLLISEYQFPHKYISIPLKFQKNVRTTAQLELFNFQEPTQKNDFGSYCGERVFHLLKKLVGNQYLEVFRILVLPEILVPQQFLQNFRDTAYVQLNNVQDPAHKNELDNYDPLTISNVQEKLAQNQHICVATQNNSSL